MKKHLLLATILSSFFLPVSSGLAADLDLPPPPPPVDHLRPATYDWSGAYFGGFVGSSCTDGLMTDNTPVPSVVYLNAGCGYKGGVTAGYQREINDVVFGAEIDWATTSNLVTNPTPGADFKFGMLDEATARARLGYAFDDTMFFVTGGAAWAYGDLTDNFSTTALHSFGSHWGWTVGGGVEHALTDQFRVKLDYLYTSFIDTDYNGMCGCNIHGGPGTNQEVRLGFNYAF